MIKSLLALLAVLSVQPCMAETVLPANNPSSVYGWGNHPAGSTHWSQPPKKMTSPKVKALSVKTTVLLPPKPANVVPENVDRKIVIDIPSRTLTILDGQKAIRQFPVGVGRVGFMTPLGKHQVIRKIENPGWENPYKSAGAVTVKPGANNPLGTRWIGFKADPRGEFGIHGTDRPLSVGKLSSHGCVRMRVPDAEKVFGLVDVGTPVEVTYQTIQLNQTPAGNITLTRYPDWFKRGMPTLQQVKQQITLRFGDSVSINELALMSALGSPTTERPVLIGLREAASPALGNPAVSTAVPMTTTTDRK